VLLSFRPGRIEIDILVVAFVVVEDHFEHPLGLCQVGLDQLGAPVPVLDTLHVAVGGAHAVALVRLHAIDVRVVLRRVLIDDGVAPVVAALADQPREHATGIANAALWGLAVQRRDVVATDGTPMDVTGRSVSPALDAREQSLDARAVPIDREARRRDVVRVPAAVRLEHWHQVLGAGEDEDVRTPPRPGTVVPPCRPSG
jgi:hypothetical protein